MPLLRDVDRPLRYRDRPRRYRAAFGLILLSEVVAVPAPAKPVHGTPIAAAGTTAIPSRSAITPAVAATITTRLATPAEIAAPRATRCSGGRTACSLVDRLTITVGGQPVEIPPRAVLLLADVDEAEIVRLGAGRYELILTCGDGAPAYQARLFFTGRRVERMDIWSDEAGMVEQSTTFRDVDKAFR